MRENGARHTCTNGRREDKRLGFQRSLQGAQDFVNVMMNKEFTWEDVLSLTTMLKKRYTVLKSILRGGFIETDTTTTFMFPFGMLIRGIVFTHFLNILTYFLYINQHIHCD